MTLPEHITKILPRARNVFVVAPTEDGFQVALFYRGHPVEVKTASSLPEARRFAAQLVDKGATGFVEGAA